VSAERTLAGPILGFVGGFVILVYGAVEAYAGETYGSSFLLDAGVAGIVLGLFVMVFAVLLAVYPEAHVVLGSFVIVFSIFSLVSVGGGNGVGFLLAVLGGTFGIVFGPEATPSTNYPARSSPVPFGANPTASVSDHPLRGCVACGKSSPATLTVCPYCGSKFGD
jgi:Family of unknown function (DUF6114)